MTSDFLILGSRYVSWLPSFSVEVTHTQLLRSDQPQPAQTSQLDAMARQVSGAI
jgi:autocrine motility factor receptor